MNTETGIQTVETPNLKIRYRTAGTGEIPLVFLHGNYASSRWWLPQLERLPLNTTAYAPDLRGCGSETGLTEVKKPHKKSLGISDLSKDLHEFLSALEIKKPVLIGHSLGGVVVLDYALSFEEQISSLVLEDTGPPSYFPFLPFPGTIFFPLELGGKTIIKRVLRLAGLANRGSFPKALISDAVAGKTGQYLEFTQAVLNWNVSSKLSGFNQPVLLIWGQKDLIMPLRIGKHYQKRFSNAKLTIIEEAGHTPHLENPESFASALAGFLKQYNN